MPLSTRLLPCLFAAAAVAFAAGEPAAYRKLTLSDKFYCEGAAFGDVNRDGHADAIAGPYWYEGPDFSRRHEIYPAVAFDPLRYSENFLTFTDDFNADGWLDVLVLGFPGVDASWFENPGNGGGPWQRHVVFMPVDNESPTFTDLLGNGRRVLLCSSSGRVGYATRDARDPIHPWAFHPISAAGPWQRFTHGLGCGDVNGDGRLDVLDKDGWWEQPAKLDGDPVWPRHPFPFSPTKGAAQMYVYDVNGDGLPDVIACLDPHGYGLAWFEQVRGAPGETTFREHAILSTKPDEKIGGVQFSQPHALELCDVDGDGRLDLVTGKRWWAHGPTGDVDAGGAPVLYAFLLRRGANGEVSYLPYRIDDASGIGTQFMNADVNGDGRPDFITANKRGTFVFLSQKSPATP